MFEALKDKLESVLSRLRNKGRLSEADVDLALREMRKSLLEADVDFKVVRDFVAKIRERAVQLEVLESITATQRIAAVVYEELVSLMGESAPLNIASMPPTVILMAGLQGSGKTTTTVKLARRLKDSHSPLVVACDLRRPAAVEQLRVLADGSGVAFFGPLGESAIYDRKGKKELKKWNANDVDPASQEGDNRLSDPIRGVDNAHVAGFLKCVRYRSLDTAQPIDSSLKSNLLTELGNVSMLTGEAIHIDPATGRLKDPGCAAAKFWTRQYEPGWEVKA